MTICVKIIATFLILFFIMGCEGPKRDPIEPTSPSGGNNGNTGGNTSVGTNTGSSPGASPASTGSGSGPSTKSPNQAGGASGNPGGSQPTTPVVRFSEVRDIFQRECFACHGNPAVASALQAPVVDWANYQATKPYVENGKLFERVWTLREDQTRGMPQNGGNITDEEREKIKHWIEGGGLE